MISFVIFFESGWFSIPNSLIFFSNFVIKFFADSKTNRNRVLRAQNLVGLVPTILDSTDNFYKYEKAEGELFSKSVRNLSFQK